MYSAPNPVAAAQQVARDTAQRLYQHATPKPRETPVYPDWWGRHCDFIYSLTTLADFPPVPTFHRGNSK